MSAKKPEKWLLLIHQIPPKPDALRVRIWRRLQQVGAVAIKQSVYALPFSENAREDFSWIRKEIVEGGGDGSVVEARFFEGLSDNQVVSLFNQARTADYEKLTKEASLLVSDWTSGNADPLDPATKAQARVARLRRKLEEIQAMDFFGASKQKTARLTIDKLASLASGQTVRPCAPSPKMQNFQSKIWVTRKNPFVDRMGCAWLIQRFVDSDAVFKFVTDTNYIPAKNEVRFDMFNGEFTHQGDLCSFEVMVQALAIHDPAVLAMAQVIHDIDLKDKKFGRNQTPGFQALLEGLVASYPNDAKRMEHGINLYETLYAYFHTQAQQNR